jgi:fucose permease
MPQTFHRDRFTWMAYLFLAFYGYFLNVLGPITPFLKDELHLSYTVSSLHFTAFAVGILLIGLGGHVPIRRLGRWRALWIGAAGMSVGALLLVAGRTPAITIGAAFLMGAIGSLILAVVPSALSDRHGEQRAVAISEANVIASFVTTAAPLLVGWFAYSIGGWRLALVIVAVALLLMYLGFGKVASPMGPSIQEDPAQAHRPLPTLYWVYWTALVLAVSVEFCMIFWSADYLMTVLGMPKADAAQAVSLFLAGMLLGRLTGSRLVRYLAASRLVIGATLVAALGFLIFWRTETAILGLSGLFITGLGVASMYPLILSLAMGTAPNNTIQASARATLASGTAILTLPLVLGRLADAIGIRLAYGVVALLLLGVFLMIQFAGAPHPVQPS